MLEEDHLLTTAEVARIFRVDPKTVGRWADRGWLDYSRTLGGHRRFRQSEISRIIAEGVREAQARP